MIRLTGGQARGRVLREAVPRGVRPTSSRVREALFSLVGQELSGLRFLDAFGGAGLVALEAWSRGATVTVVERSPRVARSLRSRATEVSATLDVRIGDVLQLASGLGGFDGVFADPPYADDPAPVLDTLGPLAREWLVYEGRWPQALPETAGELVLDRSRGYGERGLWVYRGR